MALGRKVGAVIEKKNNKNIPLIKEKQFTEQQQQQSNEKNIADWILRVQIIFIRMSCVLLICVEDEQSEWQRKRKFPSVLNEIPFPYYYNAFNSSIFLIFTLSLNSKNRSSSYLSSTVCQKLGPSQRKFLSRCFTPQH